MEHTLSTTTPLLQETLPSGKVLNHTLQEVANAENSSDLESVHYSRKCCGGRSWCSSGLRLWTVLHAVLTACIMAFLVGITLTFSSPVLLELTQLTDPEFRFDTGLADLFGAAPLVGAVFGGPIAGYVSDGWGRKTALLLNSLPYLVGYFIIVCSHLASSGAVFKVALMVGRFISGIGMGWAYIVVPVYIGEVTPTELRSMLGTFPELSLTTGILVLYGLGSIPRFQYYNLALVPIGVLVLYMLLAVWIPETPRWLLLKSNDQSRVIELLKYLRGPNNMSEVVKEIRAIKSTLPRNEPNICLKLRLLLCQRSHLVPFLLVTFLYVFQQLCGGGSTVVAYAAQIFQAAGAPNPDLTSTYAVGASLVVATVLASLLIERLGRKTLASVSAAGMFTGSMMLVFHSYFTRSEACSGASNGTLSTLIVSDPDAGDVCNPHLFPLAIASVVVFILSFSFGLGPVPWVLLSEYLPLSVRGVAGGIVVACSWMAAVFITEGFLSYSALVGNWVAWLTLAAINLFGLIIIVVFIKETKGRTLEQVEELFNKKNMYSFTKCCTREAEHV